jgi:hypothetical protein
MISLASGAGTETFSYADRTQAELLSDGSAGGITYGLAGQDGQPWVQDYTAATSGEQVNVLHDQQGDILGEDNSNAGDIMYVTDNLGSVVAVIDSSGHGTLNNPYTPYASPRSIPRPTPTSTPAPPTAPSTTSTQPGRASGATCSASVRTSSVWHPRVTQVSSGLRRRRLPNPSSSCFRGPTSLGR